MTYLKTLRIVLIACFAIYALSISGCQSGNHEEKEDTEHADDHDNDNETGEAEHEEEDHDDQDKVSTEALPSPRQQASGDIEGVTIKVDYGSPAVKGREIWGGLEAYGKVWRAGANETTSVEFSKNVNVNGQALAAGKYGLFIIPNENSEWIVIFNKGWDAWGAFSYEEDQDVLRVEVEPHWDDEVAERLTYTVSDDLGFAWGKARIHLDIKPQ